MAVLGGGEGDELLFVVPRNPTAMSKTHLVSVATEVPPRALDTEAAAAYLGRPGSAKTLQNWRSLGKGPRHIIVLGRPAYLVADLDAYLAAGGDPS